MLLVTVAKIDCRDALGRLAPSTLLDKICKGLRMEENAVTKIVDLYLWSFNCGRKDLGGGEWILGVGRERTYRSARTVRPAPFGLRSNAHRKCTFFLNLLCCYKFQCECFGRATETTAGGFLGLAWVDLSVEASTKEMGPKSLINQKRKVLL